MDWSRKFGLLVSAAAAASLLAACGSVTGGSGSAGSGSSGASGSSANGSTGPVLTFNEANSKVVYASGQRGGSITVADPGTPDSTDPGNTDQLSMWNFSRLYATPLMTYESCPGSCGLTLMPGLATSPGVVSEHGLAWTYHITPGLRFSDGLPITSADIKYAVERTFARNVLPDGPTYFQDLLAPMTPAYPGPYADRSPAGDTSISTPNRTTIVFHLAKPFADFNYVVATPQTAPVPPSKDTRADYQYDPVSSGPYMFVAKGRPGAFRRGRSFTLVDNPHWVPAEDRQARQMLGSIAVDLNVGANQTDADLLGGTAQVDLAGTGVQPAAQQEVLTNPELFERLDDPLTGYLWFAYINTRLRPLNDVHCRQAIEFAANKSSLQQAVGGNFAGGQIASAAMPQGIGGYSSLDNYDALSQPDGNLTAARAQLALCGHPKGFTVAIGYRSNLPEDVAQAKALQTALARVGITGVLRGFPSARYYTAYAGNVGYVHRHDLGIDLGGASAAWPNAYGWFDPIADGQAITPTGNTNISQLNDPVVNNLLATFETPGVSAARKLAIAGQIDARVMKDAAILPEVDGQALLYRSPVLTNVYVQAYYGMYNYAVLGLG
jgi:peptide/nickel transport system substrate-binding protein